LHYQIISSERIREPYQIKNKDYAAYLKGVEEITENIGDFIKDCLPVFSSYRKDFRYIRKKREFLIKHENLLKIRVKTDKADKLIRMRLEQPSFVLIPLLLFKSRGLKKGKPLDDRNFKKMLVKEGERLSRLFTFASLDEFRQKKRYGYIKSERAIEKREKFLVEEIKRMGVKRAIKEVGKSKGILDFRRET